MRHVLFAAALTLALPLPLLCAHSAQAQGLPSCNGLERTSDGVKATMTTKKDTNTSGQTEVTLSLNLKDVAGGRSLASPSVKTPMGKPAEVSVGDPGEPGALKMTFSPNAMGGASSVDVSWIGADGKSHNMQLSCTL